MNTSSDHDDENALRCAEYALGVLDAAERDQVERAIKRDGRTAALVALWQQRLAPLSEDIVEIAPPPYLWPRIQSGLGFATPEHVKPGLRLWDSLRLWRWVGIGASLAAAALASVWLVSIQQTPVATTGNGYMVANLARNDGVAGWTATIDLQRALLVIVPANVMRTTSDRSTELWLVPPGSKPISLGVIAADQPAMVRLPHDMLARLSGQAVLAVSLEPRGGSPTGQPTGPILAKGAVRGT